ncbi:hypothetical protein LTS09_017483 [Friedmanniomyces endolithicus]|nr:hypothetical protein LTS09_017483 [Friedmanniomyces endolithicus]
MVTTFFNRVLCFSLAVATVSAFPTALEERQSSNATFLSTCPDYKASNVKTTSTGLSADLTLADECLHVKNQDAANQIYQVPPSVFTRPSTSNGSSGNSELQVNYIVNPFSFSVTRKGNADVLFDTSAASLVFESQYLTLRTKLPENPSLYVLGEHTDPLDAYTVPAGTNLYGDHPVYFDDRGANGTHVVFLLNSNGMNIVIDNIDGQYLEYNTIGGVLDFYFMVGSLPVEVAQQYSEVVGKSAMMPYWGFGFHQCRYGMQDVYEVAREHTH